MYQELLVTSIILNFFDSIITAIMIFAVAYFMLYFYRFSYIFGVIFAILFFLRSFYIKLKTNKILIIEKKYPDLRERLRTSFDYQNRSNHVIDSLHKDISKLIKKVDVNAYLEMKKIFFKVIIICVLLISVLLFSSYGLDVLELATRVEQTTIFTTIKDAVENIAEKINPFEKTKLEDPKLLDLGSEEKNLSIETFNTEIDINNIEEPEKNDFGGHYPEEIKGASQQVYDEGISEENKDVVQEYFERINE